LTQPGSPGQLHSGRMGDGGGGERERFIQS